MSHPSHTNQSSKSSQFQSACLLLHGFTGGPFEVAPLARYLADCGWSCMVPTLAGHGGQLCELRYVTRQDWIGSAAAAADDMVKKFGTFDLVGFSMGGLLAAYLANRYPVRKLVLLNSAVIYLSPIRFAKNVVRELRSGNKLKFKHETPFPAVLQFMRLVREMTPELRRIRVPTFIAHGDCDEIVHPKSGDYIFSRIQGEKELHLFPNSRHLICLDEDAPDLFVKVERFLMGGERAH